MADWYSGPVHVSGSVFESHDPTSPGGPLPGSTFKTWNGSAWVPGILKRWDGASWVAARPKRWNGSAWVTVP